MSPIEDIDEIDEKKDHVAARHRSNNCSNKR